MLPLNSGGVNATSSSTTSYYVPMVIATYWTVSISMVYLNKMILSGSDDFKAPLFVTWYQCIVTCVICSILGRLGEKTRAVGKGSFLDEFPVVIYDVRTAINVLTLSVIFVGMITFNNVCLQYVAVSFYNVARSLSIVFTVIFTYILLQKPTSLITCSTLAVVILGFNLGVQGEVDFSLFGTIAGVLSSVFVSLNSIYTSKTLPKVNGDKNVLLYYNNLNACVLFLPFIFYFEGSYLLNNIDKLQSLMFWVCMTITGIMGWAIGLVTVMQIKATTPLTHNISGTAKAAVQSLIAFYVWGNEATFYGIMGIFLVIFGSGLYTYIQSLPAATVKKAEGIK